MTKILAPNKEFNGIQASVKFVNGVGETDSPYLIDYFKRKGYTIGQNAKKNNEVNQVKETTEAKEYNKTSKEQKPVNKKPSSPKPKTKKK